MTKAEIRRLIAERKSSVPCLETLNAKIVERINSLEPFRAANTVGVYMPLAGEVDITPLFQLPNKTFYIPAFNETSGGYRMARLTADFKKGRFGIPEPASPVFAAEDELDVILVPGVAFDRAGRRIGRGGGFYDRLLPQYRAIQVGVCFEFQVLEALPAEKHDIRVDVLVTEIQILEIEMNS